MAVISQLAGHPGSRLQSYRPNRVVGLLCNMNYELQHALHLLHTAPIGKSLAGKCIASLADGPYCAARISRAS